MNRYHVIKDSKLVGSAATKEQALVMIRLMQQEEMHYMLRSEYGIMYGEEEHVPYADGTEQVERYMAQHHFLPADKYKIRQYLKCEEAVSAFLTRTSLCYFDKLGMAHDISRSLLGIQDNFD